jgi:Ni/Co efflux regulator RcnB
MNKTWMRLRRVWRRLLVLLVVLVALPGTSAWAEKPDWAGGKGRENREDRDNRDDRGNRSGKSDKGERGDKADRRDSSSSSGLNIVIGFTASDRGAIEAYYRDQARAGQCPPGLAKKNNGCQPPGQAKAWRKGQALAAGLPVRDLSPELRIRLPLPPVNHRYVELAGDILLVAVGTAIVVDAVENILR